MNEADALDLFQAAIWTVLIAAGPAVIVAMAVGLIIALIQALTQVQEATLTFVPKIVAVLITVGVTAPFAWLADLHFHQSGLLAHPVRLLEQFQQKCAAVLRPGLRRTALSHLRASFAI